MTKTIEIGTRVKTIKAVENYPVIYLEPGATGTLAFIDPEGAYWVTLDEVHEELAEWENQIQIWDFSEQDGPSESPASYLEAL